MVVAWRVRPVNLGNRGGAERDGEEMPLERFVKRSRPHRASAADTRRGQTGSSRSKFADGSFLELVAQRKSAPALGEAVSAFLRSHEGAWKMGVSINDAAAVRRHLTGRGLKVSEPSGGTWQGLTGRTDLPKEMWTGLDLLETPGHLAYVWHFTPGWDEMRARMPAIEPLRAASTTHANSAIGLRTPWLATWDLRRTAREFAFLSKTPDPPFAVPRLQALGQWLELARGRIPLLQPADDDSPVMQHLFVRGEGLMAASIEVQDLERAQRLVERRSGQRFPSYRGLEGTAILLPATFIHGVALELFQRPNASP